MTMGVLLDSSAILAFLWGEPGSDKVSDAFNESVVSCTVANWAEVVAKVVSRSGDWNAAEAALVGRGLQLIPIEVDDAVAAGQLWDQHRTLSLGDRLCLAAGQRRGDVIVTADRAWADVSEQVQLIR